MTADTAPVKLTAEPSTREERARHAALLARWIASCRRICREFPTSEASRHWRHTKDGDWSCGALYRHHYSCGDRTSRSALFVGPGEKLVLLSEDGLAAFAWRRFIDDSGQTGVCCALFASYSPVLASTLIREAEEVAWQRWPGARLYTFVNPAEVKSPVPGACFRAAGWRSCGHTPRGLLILEKRAAILSDHA